GDVEELLELLEQRLGLQLRLDRDLLGERDQQPAALDQPGQDLAVTALLHTPPSLAFLQLALPVEHARLGALGLRLGDHARRLVAPRQRRVREDVVGLELAQSLRRLDRLRMPPEIVQRERETLPAVGEVGVDGDGFAIACDRIVQLAVRDQVHRLVIELVLVGHWRWVALWLRGGKPWRRSATRCASSRDLLLRFRAESRGLVLRTGTSMSSPRTGGRHTVNAAA